MFDSDSKLCVPCSTCKREGIERAAGPGFIAGLRGYPLWLCPEHGGKPYVTETIERGN